MTRFFLIRHGNTDAVGKKLSGRMEGVALNETGTQQAKNIIKHLHNVSIHHIFSSPMQRAIETAKPLADHLHLPVQTDDLFNEIDFGGWTNKSIDSLKTDPQFQLFNSSRSQCRIPGGESMAEAQLRFVSGIEKLSNQFADKNIAVFSHADMIRAGIIFYLGMPLDMIHRFEIDPGSISIIENYTGFTRVILLNYTGEIKM